MSKALKIKVCIIIAALAAFSLIAYIVETNDVLRFDTVIREAVYSIRRDFLTTVLTAITYLGNWQSVTIICIIALVIPKTRIYYGLPLAVTAISSTIVYKVVKTFFARPRPDISLHLIDQGGYSFPSGHSMTGLVFFGLIIWLCHKKFKGPLPIILSLLIFLIGFSRIYLGVHYPTDVLAGWLLGAAFLTLVTIILSRFVLFKTQSQKLHGSL